MKTCTIAHLLLLSILFSISAVSNPFEIVRELDIGARASLTYDSNLFGVSETVYQEQLDLLLRITRLKVKMISS
jgi:hypothetical protein